jgi:hypothetical protein
VVIAAGLVLTRVVEFTPPEQVRHESEVGIVGDSPAQSFADELGHAQAVQIRATLRRYDAPDLDVGEPDPELDGRARILSRPVVTTILGLAATIEQTVRLERDALAVDVEVEATPRPLRSSSRGRPVPLSLEVAVRVTSRRSRFFGEPQRRVHLDNRATLTGVEERSHRVVFSVDDHLFALDLELHRPYG